LKTISSGNKQMCQENSMHTTMEISTTISKSKMTDSWVRFQNSVNKNNKKDLY